MKKKRKWTKCSETSRGTDGKKKRKKKEEERKMRLTY